MPHPSPYPTFEVPDIDLYEFLFTRPDKKFPDNHTAFVDGNTKKAYTHSDVRESSKRFGTGIKSMWDWKKGDVLLVFSTNNIDTPAITFGTLWAGGVVTPANPAYTVDELTFQLKDSKAKAICTIPALYPIALAAAKNVGIEKDMIIFLGDKPAAGWPDKLHSWRDIFDQTTTVKWRKPKVNPSKELAFLVYSSGTTGHPKGVMISHTNLVANVLQQVNVEAKTKMLWSRDKIIAFLPMFHIYGLTCMMLQAFYSGTPMVVMDRFDLVKFCTLVQEEKITYVYAVPPVVLLLAKHPIVEKFNLSSIRMINSGAAPLTHELVAAVSKRLGLHIKQGYGLSEASPTTHMQAWEDWWTKIGTVGKLLPNMIVKYMSEDGKELPAGETGEIWLKGPNIMLGYLNNPQATKNTITDDGYLKTGDVGHCDKDGNLYITDRAKELIKYKGFQVPPAELEGLLTSHPKVDDAAVTGIYSAELASEVPRAYVVLAKDVPATPETIAEIHAFIDSKVAQHKRLRGGIRFIDVIPKSASGKILRRILKDQIKAEAEKDIKAKL